MRLWWFRAPQWAISLVMGGLFGLFAGIYTWLQDRQMELALVAAVCGGLVFGLVMGGLLSRQFERSREIVGEQSPEVVRAAARGSQRGAVPGDPVVRDAALRLARYQLGELRRRRTFNSVAFACFLALEMWAALTRSPWFWLAVAFFAVMLLVSLVSPRRLERRIELLQG